MSRHLAALMDRAGNLGRPEDPDPSTNHINNYFKKYI